MSELTITEDLVDRLVGFLVMIEKADDIPLLINISKVQAAAAMFHQELQKLRGTHGYCRLCDPPVRMLVEEFEQHDITIHKIKKAPCLTPHPEKPLLCRYPRGHRGVHKEGYTTWE